MLKTPQIAKPLFAKHLKAFNLLLISNVFNSYLFESDILTEGKPKLDKGKLRKIVLYLEKRLRKDLVKK